MDSTRDNGLYYIYNNIIYRLLAPPCQLICSCISCLLLGTIKQLHWDDLRKSIFRGKLAEDSWDLRPRRTWQSVDLAAISVKRSPQAANFTKAVTQFSRRACQCSLHNSPVPSSHFGSLVISLRHSSLQRTLRQGVRLQQRSSGVGKLPPGMTAARLPQRTHRNSLQ